MQSWGVQLLDFVAGSLRANFTVHGVIGGYGEFQCENSAHESPVTEGVDSDIQNL